MLNILVAYPYWSDGMVQYLAELNEAGKVRLFIDSGAFTAWKSGKPIELDDYCRFIEQMPIKPWRYLMLDVIGDPEATMKNYEIMLERGFNPVPIFTRGEDPKILDKLYETSDIVAVGGLVGTQKNKGFAKGILDHLNGRPAHFLGFTNKAFVKVVRPYSVDSSSAFGANRFGNVELFDRRTGSWVKVSREDFAKRPPDSIIENIKSYGINPAKLALKASWSGAQPYESMRLSFASHVRASVCYEKILNVKYFLALSQKSQVDWIVEAYKREMNPHDRMHAKNPVLLGTSSPEP